jgi:hypothetical protein
MSERETLLAEIAERQARLAQIDAEPDYEAWRPALEAYLAVDDIAAKPSTPLDSWDRQCIRGLIAAFAKAPPMGERQPRWPSEEGKVKLVNAIINAYHTTRLGDTPFPQHILSKAFVKDAFARAYQTGEQP